MRLPNWLGVSVAITVSFFTGAARADDAKVPPSAAACAAFVVQVESNAPAGVLSPKFRNGLVGVIAMRLLAQPAAVERAAKTSKPQNEACAGYGIRPESLIVLELAVKLGEAKIRTTFEGCLAAVSFLERRDAALLAITTAYGERLGGAYAMLADRYKPSDASINRIEVELAREGPGGSSFLQAIAQCEELGVDVPSLVSERCAEGQKPSVERFPNNAVKARGCLDANSRKIGKWEFLSTSGKKEMDVNIAADGSQGRMTFWYSNGRKKFEAAGSRDGKQEGLVTQWYESGTKESEATMRGGLAEGVQTRWFQNGQTRTVTNFKAGKPEGTITSWYENGHKESEGALKNGEPDGLMTEWHENGQKRLEATYRAGRLEGPETRWISSGKKVPPNDAARAPRGEDSQLTPAEVYTRVSPGVGFVFAGQSFGSVVAVSRNRVVTNWHVVAASVAKALPKVTLDGDQSEAVVVGVSVEQDLAVLQLLVGSINVIPERRQGLPEVGERVFSIGSPQGLNNSLADGLVSNLRVIPTGTLIQTSAPISKGSSGGGLFDDRGRLVGITLSMVRDSQQLNFAVPMPAVESLLQDLFSQAEAAQNIELLSPLSREVLKTVLSAGEAQALTKLKRPSKNSERPAPTTVQRAAAIDPPTASPPIVAAPPEVPSGLLNLMATDSADVYLDGRRIGGAPRLGIRVRAGSHKVRLDCYDTAGNTVAGAVQVVEVKEGAEVEVRYQCPEW